MAGATKVETKDGIQITLNFDFDSNKECAFLVDCQNDYPNNRDPELRSILMGRNRLKGDCQDIFIERNRIPLKVKATIFWHSAPLISLWLDFSAISV